MIITEYLTCYVQLVITISNCTTLTTTEWCRWRRMKLHGFVVWFGFVCNFFCSWWIACKFCWDVQDYRCWCLRVRTCGQPVSGCRCVCAWSGPSIVLYYSCFPKVDFRTHVAKVHQSSKTACRKKTVSIVMGSCLTNTESRKMTGAVGRKGPLLLLLFSKWWNATLPFR